MNKTETAQQLRLAAGILETEHPFEVCRSRHKEWFTPDPMVATEWMPPEYEVRPVLATPPDGKPLHNPDNLSAEQVGLGYRLLTEQEIATHQNPVTEFLGGGGEWLTIAYAEPKHYDNSSYRLPLSVPWPKAEKSDTYAETTKQVPLGSEDLIAKLKEAIAMLESLTNKKA
jgi:hypothetical protein